MVHVALYMSLHFHSQICYLVRGALLHMQDVATRQSQYQPSAILLELINALVSTGWGSIQYCKFEGLKFEPLGANVGILCVSDAPP